MDEAEIIILIICYYQLFFFFPFCFAHAQVEYSRRQIRDLLSMINAGNMPNKNKAYESMNRGLHRSISAYGIVGKLYSNVFSQAFSKVLLPWMLAFLARIIT